MRSFPKQPFSIALLFNILLIFKPMIGLDFSTTEISFQSKGHYIVVTGTVGKLQNLNLVVDTGATFTWIRPGIAKRLGLKGDSGCNSLALGRTVATRRVVLDGVRIGDLTFDSVEARIGVLPYVPKFRIDALIGLNLLKRLNLIIDLQRRKLIIEPSESLVNSQAFNPSLPFVMVRLSIGGSVADLLLDTGAEDLILFNNKERRWRRVTGTKHLNHVGGRVRLRRIMLSNVSFVGTKWDKLPAYEADISPDAYGGLDGILGGRSLGLKRLHLDFPNGRLGWE